MLAPVFRVARFEQIGAVPDRRVRRTKTRTCGMEDSLTTAKGQHSDRADHADAACAERAKSEDVPLAEVVPNVRPHRRSRRHGVGAGHHTSGASRAGAGMADDRPGPILAAGREPP